MPSFHVRTPLLLSRPLEAALGAPVFLKMEALQPTGSFKIRGIGRVCREAVKAGAKRLVSSSGGNAGLAAAYAGKRLGVETVVIVPETTPEWMRSRIEAEGAKVRVHGEVWDEAHAEALGMAREAGSFYVSPFDHPSIWAGHASLIDEIAEQRVKPGAVVLAVGGGGLLCGVLKGLEKAGWPDTPVIAVETEGTASLAASLRAGKLVTLEKISGVATSLGARRVAQAALDRAVKSQVASAVVSDEQAIRATLRFADDHRLLVEPACGAVLAAIYDRAPAMQKIKGPVVAVVCGGAAVTLEKIQEWSKQARA